jgi:hypothetical protein
MARRDNANELGESVHLHQTQQPVRIMNCQVMTLTMDA